MRGTTDIGGATNISNEVKHLSHYYMHMIRWMETLFKPSWPSMQITRGYNYRYIAKQTDEKQDN